MHFNERPQRNFDELIRIGSIQVIISVDIPA